MKDEYFLLVLLVCVSEGGLFTVSQVLVFETRYVVYFGFDVEGEVTLVRVLGYP